MSVLTFVRSSAFAPPARRERAEMSYGKKPNEGPRNDTAVRRVSVMRRDVTLAGPRNRTSGVPLGKLFSVS